MNSKTFRLAGTFVLAGLSLIARSASAGEFKPAPKNGIPDVEDLRSGVK